MAKPDGAAAQEEREKAVIDQVAEDVANSRPDGEPATRDPITPSGQPVEEQVRKEWDPKKQGGLPTFLRD